jgi:hypothetical protein
MVDRWRGNAANWPSMANSRILSSSPSTKVQVHEETEERTVIHHSGCRFTDEPQLNPTALGRGHTEQEMKKYPIEGL